jgi:hypothetical protein
MRGFTVTMYEGHRLIYVRVAARGTAHAARKAIELCPDAVLLSVERVRP